MKHLILVGACYLDTVLTVPRYPEEDSKLRATKLSLRRGGNCPNSLEVLQQLLREEDHVKTYLVSPLPDENSEATRRIKSSFGDECSSLSFDFCIYRTGHTEAASSYILRSEETGTRTIVNYNTLPEMTSEEFSDIAQSFSPDQDTWWHFEGRLPDITLQCIHFLRRQLPGAKISVEVEKPGRDGLLDLAALADVVFFSKAWAESRGHGSAEACLHRESPPRASLAVCAWGAEGATAKVLSTGKTIHSPAPSAEPAITVVDTIGAGDTLIAGILYSLLCHTGDWSHQQGLQFAVKVASAKVQHEGFGGLRKVLHLSDGQE